MGKEELELVVGGKAFPIRRVSISWQMMRFAAAQQKAGRIPPHPDRIEEDKEAPRNEGDPVVTKKVPCVCERCTTIRKEAESAGMDLMLAMRDTALVMVKAEYREEFIDFLNGAELEVGELEDAIGDAIGKIGSEADTTEGKALEAQLSPSSESDTPTYEVSRHVSLSGKKVDADYEQSVIDAT